MHWYLNAFKNYLNFSWRARRKEYWLFILFNFIISFVLAISEELAGLGEWLSRIYFIVVFLPTMAVMVRRLHDIGRSGWWLLIGLVPLIGQIVLFVLACFDSEDHENEWGPNPKQHDSRQIQVNG
jgi:uncharacterized membrane protein YhaH (DUF805 family)